MGPKEFTEAELVEMEQHATKGGAFAHDDVGRLLKVLREKKLEVGVLEKDLAAAHEILKARDTRVEDEKRLYTQNDTYLRDQLKEKDRLNGEYRKLLEKLASLSVLSKLNITEEAMALNEEALLLLYPQNQKCQIEREDGSPCEGFIPCPRHFREQKMRNYLEKRGISPDQPRRDLGNCHRCGKPITDSCDHSFICNECLREEE